MGDLAHGALIDCAIGTVTVAGAIIGVSIWAAATATTAEVVAVRKWDDRRRHGSTV